MAEAPHTRPALEVPDSLPLEPAAQAQTPAVELVAAVRILRAERTAADLVVEPGERRKQRSIYRVGTRARRNADRAWRSFFL